AAKHDNEFQTNHPPQYDEREEFEKALKSLEEAMKEYKAAKQSTDDDELKAVRVLRAENRVIAAFEMLQSIDPDLERRVLWEERKAKFKKGDTNEKEHILEGLGKGLAILLLTPFVVAGGAIFAAGSIVYGAGKVVVGLGNLLT